jgi:hypothetical protein
MPNATRHVRPKTFGLAAFGAALVLVALLTPGTEAHKAITSPYNYNDHVFPILRDRCGRCHFPDGPAPMSLLTYRDALPWAESMREQLVGERMPTWYVDPMGPTVKGGHWLTPRELDVVVTWATGGTPQGDLNQKLPPVPAHPQWRSGAPDLAIKMDAAHTLPAGTMEESCEFELPTGLTETKWVKAVDLVPGVTSMVRDALVTIENGPVVMAWVPDHDAIAAPSGAAFKLPAGAKLRLQIHYKKNWQDEQNAKTDRTTIGLYFTDEPISGRSIEALAVDGPEAPTAGAGTQGEAQSSYQGSSVEPHKFSKRLTAAARVLALRPSLDQPYASVDVQAVLPTGRHVPLLFLHAPRPEWPRRYWLAEPIELPQGTTVEVTAVPAQPNPDEIPSPRRGKFQVALDYVAQ